MLNSTHKKYGEKDEKALHKLMNNVAYGKTMENMRNRINVKLAIKEKDFNTNQYQVICTRYLTII